MHHNSIKLILSVHLVAVCIDDHIDTLLKTHTIAVHILVLDYP